MIINRTFVDMDFLALQAEALRRGEFDYVELLEDCTLTIMEQPVRLVEPYDEGWVWTEYANRYRTN
jgi:hypothetical protein